MNNLKIRDAEAHDAEIIRAIHDASIRALCTPHYSPEQIEHWVNQPAADYVKAIGSQRLLVAEFQGKPAGFAQMDPQTGVITALYVDPSCARQHIGCLLLLTLETEARAAGVPVLTVNSTLNAVDFFQHEEFIAVGPHAEVLSDGTGLACVKMEKRILLPKLEFPVDYTIPQRLVAILQNDNGSLRLQALSELRDQAPGETLNALVPLLDAPEQKMRRRAGSALSLFKMSGVGLGAKADALAQHLMRNPDERVRLSCAIVLMSAPGPAVDHAFVSALADSFEKVAQIACLEVGDRRTAEGTTALFGLLTHASWRVRLEACKALITQKTADNRVVATLASMSLEPEAKVFDAEVEDTKELVAEFSKAFSPAGTSSEPWGAMHTILAKARQVAQRSN